MIEQVWKQLPRDCDVQRVHPGEIGLADSSRVMNLRETDLLIWSIKPSPDPDAALQRAQLAIRKPTGVTALKVFKYRQRLQLWSPLEKSLHLAPNAGKRVLARAPVPRTPPLARQYPCFQIFTGSLDIQAGLGGQRGQRQSFLRQFQESPHLLFRRNHPASSPRDLEDYRLSSVTTGEM